jgi:adenylate cyclase
MGSDEAGTLARLRAGRRVLIDPKIKEHRGRIVKTTGDGMLVEFVSIVDAVHCAVDIQTSMVEHNRGESRDKRLEFRVGINVGDVVADGSDIYGDGVNIAARLEQLAEPGGICVSSHVYEQVQGKLDIPFEDAGQHQLKNIARPMRVYRVLLNGTAKSAPALPDKPSIAVMPFYNMSGDPEQEYFADGMVEEIITALSRTRWLFVIARNSSFTYKGRPVDVKRVGRELGVRYLLEGGVRKAANRVRVTSQLLDAMTGNHIWAERYDRELTDIFALQDEITASVAAAIEPKLLAAEGTRTETRSIDDLNAWDLVARALSHFWKLTAAESDTAISILCQAVERYPNYAPAHSMLAFALLVATHVGWIPGGGDREFATRLAHRAAELDDSDPWAQMALGYLALTRRKTDEAVRRFHAALELNPNFAAAQGYIGWALVFDGQSEEALRRFEQAMRMSPRDPLNGFFSAGVGAAHYFAGRYTEAIKWGRLAVQLRPGILGGHRILIASLAQAGQMEEAKAALNTLRQLHPDVSLAWIREWVPYTAKPMESFLDGLRKAGLIE